MQRVHQPRRLSKLSGSVFSAMDEAQRRARARGLDPINLSVGSPDLPPAPHIVAALRDACLDPGVYGYPLRDLPEFRAAVAAWYRGRFGVALDPETEVLGLLGSQEGLAHVTMAVADPGDLVLVPDPGYPIYHAGPVLSGAQLYPYPLRPENGFLLDPDDIPDDVWQRARLLLLNYPSNPLAAVAGLDYFGRIVERARRYSLVVLHDAAYSELAFDGYRPPSFLEAPGAREIGIEFNSLSKTYNMAGCRIAYAVGNAEVIAALAAVKGHLDYGIFRPIQQAAIVALTGPQSCVAEMAAVYQRRRDVLVSGLGRLGWKVPLPRATMFCWAPIPAGHTSLEFCTRLIETAGVVLTPGDGLGDCGEGYVRIALVQPEARLAEAVDRIAASGVLG